MDLLDHIKQDRIDLTDFLIHGTRRAPENATGAFYILQKIIRDGFLKPGWSVRGKAKKRTVFGKKPAVCFTEIPLYGFVDYVKKRNNDWLIDYYGIALLRENLFTAGARNAIYGTTLYPNERLESEFYTVDWISPEEQYRYILTTGVNSINDWMHEREWRWADHYAIKREAKNLNIWNLENENARFTPIIIILKSKNEIEEILKLFDTISNEAVEINKKDGYSLLIKNTRENLMHTGIISIDSIDFQATPYYKIEDAIFQKKVIWLRDHLQVMKGGF